MKITKDIKRNLMRYSDHWAHRAPRKKAGIIGYMALLELLVLIPEVIIVMPLLILAYCYLKNAAGVEMGDANALPASFIYLLSITAIITVICFSVIQSVIVIAIGKAWKNRRN